MKNKVKYKITLYVEIYLIINFFITNGFEIIL
jgi:hypothetical protein